MGPRVPVCWCKHCTMSRLHKALNRLEWATLTSVELNTGVNNMKAPENHSEIGAYCNLCVEYTKLRLRKHRSCQDWVHHQAETRQAHPGYKKLAKHSQHEWQCRSIHLPVLVGWSKVQASVPPSSWERVTKLKLLQSKPFTVFTHGYQASTHTHRPQLVGDRSLTRSLPPYLLFCLTAQFVFNRRGGNDTILNYRKSAFLWVSLAAHTDTQCECELMNLEQCKFLCRRLPGHTVVQRQPVMPLI